MKNILFYLYILFTIQIYSQVIEGNVYDETTNKPIRYVSIVIEGTKIGAYTNKDGYFKLQLTKTNQDSLQISSVGYQSKKVFINVNLNNNLSVSLKELEYKLEEIVLYSKNKKRTKQYKKNQGLERKGNFKATKLIGSNTAVFINNTENKQGRLKKINIYLRRTRKKSSWKAPIFLAKLNIKIYKYDSINNKPGKELYHKNIIVKPKNKNYTLSVNVDSLNIIFPKKGLCIGIEHLDENNEFKKYNHVAPSLRYTSSENKKITWTNYKNTRWNNATLTYNKVPKGFEKLRNTKSNLLINTEVTFNKEENE